MIAFICTVLGICVGVVSILIWKIIELQGAVVKMTREAQEALKVASESSQRLSKEIESLNIKVESLDFWRLQGSKK